VVMVEVEVMVGVGVGVVVGGAGVVAVGFVGGMAVVVVVVKVEIGVTFDADREDEGLGPAVRRLLESLFPSSEFIMGLTELDDGPWRRWLREVRRLTEFTEEENE